METEGKQGQMFRIGLFQNRQIAHKIISTNLESDHHRYVLNQFCWFNFLYIYSKEIL